MDTPRAEPAVSGVVVTTPPVLRLAVAAYLARFKGQSRVHSESDLRGFVTWCADRDLDPFSATRPHLELYCAGCRRSAGSNPPRCRVGCRSLPGSTGPASSTGSWSAPPPSTSAAHRAGRVPNPGTDHLQFEALLTSARTSTNRHDFALVTMLGLLGLRIFEATGSNIDDLGEEHGHRVLRVRGKGDKVVLVPLPSAVSRALERSIDERTTGPILLTSRSTRMDRHCATRRLRRLAEQAGVTLPRMHAHMLRHSFVTTMLDAGVDLRDVQIAARHADPRTTMRYDRARKNLDRHPNCILAAYMASGT